MRMTNERPVHDDAADYAAMKMRESRHRKLMGIVNGERIGMHWMDDPCLFDKSLLDPTKKQKKQKYTKRPASCTMLPTPFQKDDNVQDQKSTETSSRSNSTNSDCV